MFKNPIVKNILTALAVAGGGFVLLNLTFLFGYLFQSLVLWVISVFLPGEFVLTHNWFPPLMQAVFVTIIGLITLAVFRSKLSVLLKAIYMFVPVAVGLVTIGIFLFHWPRAAFLIGALLVIAALYHFFRTKQPWLYFYTLILVSVFLAIFSLAGGEI